MHNVTDLEPFYMKIHYCSNFLLGLLSLRLWKGDDFSYFKEE